MTTHHARGRRFRIVGRFLIGLATLTPAALAVTDAQQAPLEISSPTSGSVINPGQTMTVNVTSPASVSFANVGVVGEDPIGMSSLANGVPAQFSFVIPADIACRPYLLTADGTTTAGADVSTSVVIDVEKPTLPSSIEPVLASIPFEAAGAAFPIKLRGRFNDGSVMDVTESSRVVYASSNPGVATVSAIGEVTAVSAGNALVTATYGPPAQGIRATIQVHVPPPLFAIAPDPLAFGQQNVGSTSSLQMTLTNTTDAELEIVEVTTTGDYSATDNCVTSSPLAVGATCTITVSFTPTAVGSRPGSVRVANTTNLLPVAFRVTGTGV